MRQKVICFVLLVIVHSCRCFPPFLCVLTRVRNEKEKVPSFIRYYLNEGFSRIVVLDDRSSPPVASYVQNHSRSVLVRRVNLKQDSNQHVFLRRYTQDPLLKECTWIANVDIDEFITTRRHPERTVKEEVIRIHKQTRAHAIFIPWIFFSFTPGQHVEYIPHDILWRWNHSKHHISPTSTFKTRDRYDRIERKYIFQPKRCHKLYLHNVVCDPPVVEGTYGRHVSADYVFYNFHEPDVQASLLAIHHYRFTSERNIYEKCSKDAINSYRKLKREMCIKVMFQSNYREIYDETMLNKKLSR